MAWVLGAIINEKCCSSEVEYRTPLTGDRAFKCIVLVDAMFASCRTAYIFSSGGMSFIASMPRAINSSFSSPSFVHRAICSSSAV